MRQALFHWELLFNRMSKFIMLLVQNKTISTEWLVKVIQFSCQSK